MARLGIEIEALRGCYFGVRLVSVSEAPAGWQLLDRYGGR